MENDGKAATAVKQFEAEAASAAAELKNKGKNKKGKDKKAEKKKKKKKGGDEASDAENDAEDDAEENPKKQEASQKRSDEAAPASVQKREVPRPQPGTPEWLALWKQALPREVEWQAHKHVHVVAKGSKVDMRM